jgi:hypothetical protein
MPRDRAAGRRAHDGCRHARRVAAAQPENSAVDQRVQTRFAVSDGERINLSQRTSATLWATCRQPLPDADQNKAKQSL